jgi:uncharacterized phiE125 gp8 family phage protein
MFTDISPPPIEPVTLADAKLFLRIDHDHEDQLIHQFIESARARIEQRANIVLIERPVRLNLQVCGTSVRVPISPLQSLISVTGEDGSIPAALDPHPFPRRIVFTSAPNTHIHVDVLAGYGPSPEDVPIPLRQAILLLVADAYEHRESEISFERVSLRVEALIGPYWGPRL